MSKGLPQRGEIWWVKFDPTVGAEIQKTRPAVVISSEAIGRLPVKLVAPITNKPTAFSSHIWHVDLTPDAANGLTKPSVVDVLQMRGVDVQRFASKIGNISETTMQEITSAIVAVIEHE